MPIASDNIVCNDGSGKVDSDNINSYRFFMLVDMGDTIGFSTIEILC